MENKLRPIYQAIDNRQYSKAIKLTLLPPQNAWPITIALRCHCLVRCGSARYREACLELRSLLKVFGNDWPELDERIWLLSLDSSNSNSSGAASTTTQSAYASTGSTDKASTGTSGTAAGNAATKPKGAGKGKGSKGKKPSADVVTDISEESPRDSVSLDAVDVMDVPMYQRLEMFSHPDSMNDSISPSRSSSSSSLLIMSEGGNADITPLELTEETTLATLAIAMSSLRLHGTLSKLYSCAIHVLQSHISTMKDLAMKNTLNEQLYSLLIKGYVSNLKVIATVVEFSPMDPFEKIYNERMTLQAWEEAQFYAMSLVKISQGERLYSTWMIVAILEHYRSCERLLTLLEHSTMDASKCQKEKDKLNQKVGMLPRLAEMMTLKQIQRFVEDGRQQDHDRFPPSADDVRFFVECLETRSKFQEAIDFLDQIGEASKEGVTHRQIDDENDVKHHVGSVIQLTEKERLEMKVNLLKKMNRHDEAFQVYSDELLVMMPDQWSYWKELLDCSSSIATGSESCKMCVHVSSDTLCRHVLDRVMENEANQAAKGKGSKIPLRGPKLFSVELQAHEVQNGSVSATGDLAKAIIAYADIYASLVHCCFQDLRVYVDLLVQSSCPQGMPSDDVKSVLEWALQVRNHCDSLRKHGDEDISSSYTNADRKSDLRAYIATVKICFEVWYQLSEQCHGDRTLIQAVDDVMVQYVPSLEDMIGYWVQTMDLGSNPKDGGQKESLPGDDLVLLSAQLMTFRNRYKDEPERMKCNINVAVLLEYAMIYSPYNAYIKIAAMKQHLKNGSTMRAYEVFGDINVKQIQLESCSYFILNDLVGNGLFKEAIDQAGKIINLHSTSERDLCSYLPRAFENGNIRKGLEMLRWQRDQMSKSLQLLEAKGVIMDLAPFVGFENLENLDSTLAIGRIYGLVGGQNEGERAEKIVRDSANFYAAPSILNLVRNRDNVENVWSDNRDFTVNDYEILGRTDCTFQAFESISRAHQHLILTKLVLVSLSMKPPKKGKVVKISDGEVLDKRSRSLLKSINDAEIFLSDDRCQVSETQKLLLQTVIAVSKAFSVVATGRSNASSCPSLSDRLEEREENAMPLLTRARDLVNSVSQMWENQTNSNSSSVFKVISSVLVLVYASFNICANACSVFGWGRRKRNSKPVASHMADLAASIKGLLTEILKTMDCEHTLSGSLEDESLFHDSKVLPFLESLKESHDLLRKVNHDIIRNNQKVRARMKHLLMQMMEELAMYDVKD